jgi:hypothetical protein
MWKILKFIAHVISIEVKHGLGMRDKEYMNGTFRKELIVLEDTY